MGKRTRGRIGRRWFVNGLAAAAVALTGLDNLTSVIERFARWWTAKPAPRTVVLTAMTGTLHLDGCVTMLVVKGNCGR